MLWPAGPVVHVTNYVGEEISFADQTKGDCAYLNGRGLIALCEGDRVLCPNDEVALHREMVKYYNELCLSTLRPGDICGISIANFLTPVCAATDALSRRNPVAVDALFRGARYLVPIIGSPGIDALARRFGLASETTTQAVNIANNKKYLPRAAQRHGFLTPPTFQPTDREHAVAHFTELMALATRDPRRFERKVFVKLVRSSGGEGVQSFTSLHKFLEWLDTDKLGRLFHQSMISPLPFEGIVLQLAVKTRRRNAVPNIGIFVGASEEEDRYLGDSAQVIANDSMHAGNRGMLKESDKKRIIPVMKKIANWLRSLGFGGVAGVDIAMGADHSVWVIDINARWNASTSTLLKFNDLRRLPGVKVFWYTGKIRVPPQVAVADFIKWLRERELEFDGETGGVIPINFMTAHRRDEGHEAFVNAQIFAPNHRLAREYFNRAHMRQA